MKRRAFVQTLGAATAGGLFAPHRIPFGSFKKLDRIGLETYAVRREMSKDPDKTLAAIRAIGYTDVELLWSFNLFGRTPQQVATILKNEGLRAPSAHMSPETIFVGWERSLETAHVLGHQFLFVPEFDGWTKQTLADWHEWADRFNAAGAVARKAGIWLGFHNEASHQKTIDGQVSLDVFMTRLDPTVTRLQLDVGNMLMGGGDPMQYIQKYPDRFCPAGNGDLRLQALPGRGAESRTEALLRRRREPRRRDGRGARELSVPARTGVLRRSSSSGVCWLRTRSSPVFWRRSTSRPAGSTRSTARLGISRRPTGHGTGASFF
jgi:hypothetical protein